MGAARTHLSNHGKVEGNRVAMRLTQRAIGAAEAISEGRRKQRLSKTRLGLNAGLSESYVGKLESGECQPSLRTFALLARALGLTPLEIYFVIQGEAMRAAGDVPIPVIPPAYPREAV